MKQFAILLALLPAFCFAETTKVCLETPGTLESKLGKHKYSITSLTLSGPINGSDVRVLRDMCGIDYNHYITDGQLGELDLSEARIVVGGESYYLDEESGAVFYTSDNTVGSYFFENCPMLARLTLPVSLSSIEGKAFQGCMLESIAVPEANSAFTVKDGALYTKNFSDLIVFAVAGQLPADKTIILPEGLEVVRAYSCALLPAVKVVFPTSLTAVEPYAFYNSSQLKEINLPRNVKDFATTAFLTCTSLNSITADSSNPYFTVQDNVVFSKDGSKLLMYPAGKDDVAYTVPSGVEEIGECAFFYNPKLQDIVINNNVKSIGSSAFAYCSELKEIKIPETVTRFNDFTFQGCSALASVSLPGRMESLGAWTFDGTLLTEFTFPEGITELGDGLFFDCAGITEFRIPETVESIGESTFYQCYGAQKINIPTAVKRIGAYAFMSCSSLAGRIEIPEGVTQLDYAAFMWDSNITEMSLPSTMATVGDFVFVGLKGLQKMEVKAVTPPPCGTEVFFQTPETVELYVPEASVDAYKTATPWNTFNIQAFSGILDVNAGFDGPCRKFGLDGLPKTSRGGIAIVVDANGNVRKTLERRR